MTIRGNRAEVSTEEKKQLKAFTHSLTASSLKASRIGFLEKLGFNGFALEDLLFLQPQVIPTTESKHYDSDIFTNGDM
jgi:hypothetical protein